MAGSLEDVNTTLRTLLRERFGFASFREPQERVCETVASGRDLLLVMPTGAGKSLCYQLPGLARGGTTLVISPLLALIDDQVAKLRQLGLRAEQIHSGRPREAQRAACRRYLSGELDFLFIAPERLGVPGFPELLQKRKPTLIAIDEAHCISQWGHDFRPDYRRLRDRLSALRPAPVIALTATATPTVQDDILRQLGMPEDARLIQGFRRTNIAIEVHEVSVPDRSQACREILRDRKSRPAIVYAPTRKIAEEIARDLGKAFDTGCYHAGLPPERREEIQSGFLSGRFEVIVATVAFGMGIDKSDIRTVIHAGLPGSVEGYYQEIGRAGRDGKPSRAILLHSYADQRTQEFFLDRDYPEASRLERIFEKLGSQSITLEDLRENVAFRSKGDAREEFDKALEKLLIHHGARQEWTPDGGVVLTRGEKSWAREYERQRAHRREQLGRMGAFAQSSGCRMQFFLDHFGDTRDRAGGCGTCDRCAAPDSDSSRTLLEKERLAAIRILAALSGETEGVALGRLFEDTCEREAARGQKLVRREFEELLSALSSAGLVRVREESFTRDQETIRYRKAALVDPTSAFPKDVLERVSIRRTVWAEEITPRGKKGKKRGSKSTATAGGSKASRRPPWLNRTAES